MIVGVVFEVALRIQDFKAHPIQMDLWSLREAVVLGVVCIAALLISLHFIEKPFKNSFGATFSNFLLTLLLFPVCYVGSFLVIALLTSVLHNVFPLTYAFYSPT